jgi:hypothetical protein
VIVCMCTYVCDQCVRLGTSKYGLPIVFEIKLFGTQTCSFIYIV